jgi:hypothetical protein
MVPQERGEALAGGTLWSIAVTVDGLEVIVSAGQCQW